MTTALYNGTCSSRDGIGRVLLGLTTPAVAHLASERDYVAPTPYRRNYQPAAGTCAWLVQAKGVTHEP